MFACDHLGCWGIASTREQPTHPSCNRISRKVASAFIVRRVGKGAGCTVLCFRIINTSNNRVTGLRYGFRLLSTDETVYDENINHTEAILELLFNKLVTSNTSTIVIDVVKVCTYSPSLLSADEQDQYKNFTV